MATVEKRRNKSGEVIGYRITVAQGLDSAGRQIRRRTTWTPPRPNMPPGRLRRPWPRPSLSLSNR